MNRQNCIGSDGDFFLRDKENEDPTAPTKKRVGRKAAKRKIHFSNDIEVAGDYYQSRHIDLAKSRCSTPRNVIRTANENKNNETYTITDVMGLITSKFNDALNAQDNYIRKTLKKIRC